ncbi:MAG: hypothetical protein KDB29_05245, partial [Planctomycetes bacterium]|nr:hypothetical protein [Planctomycetota bacterium]
MNTAKLTLLALVLALLGFTPACGGKKPINRIDGDSNQVELLGSRKVNFKGDFDTIPVTLFEGTFRAIRIDVDGSALEMWDIDV